VNGRRRSRAIAITTGAASANRTNTSAAGSTRATASRITTNVAPHNSVATIIWVTAVRVSWLRPDGVIARP
jgi:hypothetical protein